MTPPARVPAATIGPPLCIYADKPCPRAGLAVLGPIVLSADGACAQEMITCLTCGSTGVKSTNLKGKAKAA